MSNHKDRVGPPKSVEISGELYARADKLAKEKGISKKEAMDLIAKGEQTSISAFFPEEFTEMIKEDLGGG